MRLEYLLPGVLMLGLGVIRLIAEGAGLHAGKAALLGYVAVAAGLVLVAAGFQS